MHTIEQVIRVYDPAFESLATAEVTKYALSRDLADLPALPPGADPVRFHFVRLTRAQVAWVQRGDGTAEVYRRAFYAGVVRITGGRFGDGWEPSNAHDPKRLSGDPAEFEEQRIVELDEQEIGGWIFTRSTVPFDCAARYPVPHMSAVVFDANAARYAARTQAAAPPSNAPPKGP